MKLGQAMYEASQAEAAAADAKADAEKSGEDVVDADFEEIERQEEERLVKRDFYVEKPGLQPGFFQPNGNDVSCACQPKRETR
jgi:hypothetical protein